MQVLAAVAPTVLEYLLAAHAEHVPQLGPVAPVLPTQLAKRVLPAGEVEIDGQAKQAASKATVKPSLAENLPVMQSVHAPDPVTVLYLPASLQIPYRHQCDSRNLMCSVHFKLRCNSW